MYNIGDKVSVLDDDMDGIITKMQNNLTAMIVFSFDYSK